MNGLLSNILGNGKKEDMFGKLLWINFDRLTVQLEKIMGGIRFKWPEMNDVS